MREFRGKDKQAGEWRYGNLVKTSKATYIVVETAYPVANVLHQHIYTVITDRVICVWYEVLPETVGQYTGKDDKDGTKIFKDDFIRNIWHNCNGEDIGDTWLVCFGEHETSGDYYASEAYGWYGKTSTGNAYDLVQIPTDFHSNLHIGLLVVGNRWDNPELMESKK